MYFSENWVKISWFIISFAITFRATHCLLLAPRTSWKQLTSLHTKRRLWDFDSCYWIKTALFGSPELRTTTVSCCTIWINLKESMFQVWRKRIRTMCILCPVSPLAQKPLCVGVLWASTKCRMWKLPGHSLAVTGLQWNHETGCTTSALTDLQGRLDKKKPLHNPGFSLLYLLRGIPTMCLAHPQEASVAR